MPSSLLLPALLGKVGVLAGAATGGPEEGERRKKGEVDRGTGVRDVADNRNGEVLEAKGRTWELAGVQGELEGQETAFSSLGQRVWRSAAASSREGRGKADPVFSSLITSGTDDMLKFSEMDILGIHITQ